MYVMKEIHCKASTEENCKHDVELEHEKGHLCSRQQRQKGMINQPATIQMERWILGVPL